MGRVPFFEGFDWIIQGLNWTVHQQLWLSQHECLKNHIDSVPEMTVGLLTNIVGHEGQRKCGWIKICDSPVYKWKQSHFSLSSKHIQMRHWKTDSRQRDQILENIYIYIYFLIKAPRFQKTYKNIWRNLLFTRLLSQLVNFLRNKNLSRR